MSDLYRLASAKLFDEAAVHPFAADPERALATGARERLRLRGVILGRPERHPGRLWPGHCGLLDLNGEPSPLDTG